MMHRLCVAAFALGLFAAFSTPNEAAAYGPYYRTQYVNPVYNGYGQGYYGNTWGNNGYSAYGNGRYGYPYTNSGTFPSNGAYGNYYGGDGTYYGGYGTSYYNRGNNGFYVGVPYSPFGIGVYGNLNNGW
jgi:hypothetical protein